MSPRRSPVLLVVDDDRVFCDAVRDSYAGTGVEVLLAHTGSEALALCPTRSIDVVLLDQRLPDAEGHALCPAILASNERTKIIFVTAHPSFDGAVQALRAGAFDYLSKPFDLEELRLAVAKAMRTIVLERVEEVQDYRSERERADTVLVGTSRAMGETRRLVELAAAADSPVLVTGETGTGKNLVAAAVHYGGPGKRGPFISVNCAAFPESLIESEIFGYEKGAFTSAVSRRKGIFEMADGGTLSLDEVGEIPLHLQAKLLAVLEEKQVRRLGGEAAKRVEVRVIASTSVPIESALGTTFRRDLYYRLNVLRIHLSPLRERRGDIPQLCEHFLRRMPGSAGVRLPETELAQLQSYEWPGNVRELRNVLERALILQHGQELRPSELLGGGAAAAAVAAPRPAPPGGAASLEEVEKSHIRAVLASHANNLSRSARSLGISLSTLKRKVKQYGLRSGLPTS